LTVRKSQPLELTTVPIKVSVYTRRQTGRHFKWFAGRKPRSFHSDMLLYRPIPPREMH
jgi:hypothetical protein